MYRMPLVVLIAATAVGCARSSTIPLAQDTVQITAAAAPACGPTGAQGVAVRQAAVETIRRGYDRFIVLGAQYQNDVRVVGHTPVVAHTTGHATATGYGNFATTQGSATTTYSGGYPIVGGTHNQGITIKMFRDGDPAGSNAVSARDTLGPNWQRTVETPTLSCLQ